ncbi:hypothetical protein stinky91_gp065 [Flavobacterium phage vB_FspS_stinky9-1]|uniref:Uncharacterized protein n=1 Tax=Flavobacterium phage vB_FspS_stinky9-1 TaxID=2686277 RepID=A0A6B9LG04_9CAUD|nr:hypothetical protein HWC98_gp65 [Flavobacterium phage vB_FspS_stinky9-1]QHB40927.1 hypothetical protein stinky91_gp065 [Flavobacterium phage vB_FspS_stinky9-1]
MIYGIIIFLFVIWYLNKKSSNDFFNRAEEDIRKDLGLAYRLYQNFGFDNIDTINLRIACEYFISNPSQYNGTSIINDRVMIKGLEPQSVKHDYDWIMATSLKDLLTSNLYYCKSLRKINVNFIWCWGFIFVGLTLVSIFKSIKYIKIK